jgi:hypothetical protein
MSQTLDKCVKELDKVHGLQLTGMALEVQQAGACGKHLQNLERDILRKVGDSASELE